MTKETSQKQQTFDVDLCRIGYGFASITVESSNEYEAQQKALDLAGNHEYSEKDAEYTLSNPVPSPQEQARMDRPAMELILEMTGDRDSSVHGARVHCHHQFVSRIVDLSALVDRHSLSEARYFLEPEEWMGLSEDGVMSLSEITMGKSWFSFVGFDDMTDSQVSSMGVDISKLVEAFDAGANRFVVLQGSSRPDDLSFVENAGIFDDERGIDGLVVMTPFEVMSQDDLQASFDKYRGVLPLPRE